MTYILQRRHSLYAGRPNTIPHPAEHRNPAILLHLRRDSTPGSLDLGTAPNSHRGEECGSPDLDRRSYDGRKAASASGNETADGDPRLARRVLRCTGLLPLGRRMECC